MGLPAILGPDVGGGREAPGDAWDKVGGGRLATLRRSGGAHVFFSAFCLCSCFLSGTDGPFFRQESFQVSVLRRESLCKVAVFQFIVFTEGRERGGRGWDPMASNTVCDCSEAGSSPSGSSVGDSVPRDRPGVAQGSGLAWWEYARWPPVLNKS